MAKKNAEKTTKKKKTSSVKKTSTKKKAVDKAKTSPFKSKLGHDPLAWITGDDASELGLKFDDIEVNSEQTINELDQILPATSASDNTTNTNHSEENAFIEETQQATVVETAAEPEPVLPDDSWGLFEDDDADIVVAGQSSSSSETTSDDGSWGLFGDDSPESDKNPDEGIAWGLFEDELAVDINIDHDALTLHLPVNFVVSEVSKVFHEFEELISKSHDVVIDATDIETIDATGLQLLFAGRRELQKNGCKMVIKDASKRVDLLSRSSFINELIGISG